MNSIRRIACVSLFAAFFLGACAGPSSPDGGLLVELDRTMRAATPGMAVSLRLSSEQVRTGGAIGASVGANSGGYVYLFQLGTDGRSLGLVFPNAMDGANYVAAGTQLTLPRPNWRMSARGPAGVGHLLAVLTPAPLDLLALQQGVAAGDIKVAGPYGAAMATVREVAP
ncbi:MAG: DUF4384 domain-containing protein [Pseudomonadota bacterium]